MNGSCYFHFNSTTSEVQASAMEHLSGCVSVQLSAGGMDVALFLNKAQLEALRETVNSFRWKPEAEVGA